MKPVMFCRNTSGILRWQHSSMKCAPLTADSLNRMPLLAMMPTGMPSMRAKPQTGGAEAGLELVEAAAVDDAGDDLAHVEGLARVDGITPYSSPPSNSGASGGRSPATALGISGWPRPRASASSRCRSRPDGRPRRTGACASPPPRSSALTTSPVAAFTSGGPPRKMVPWFLTMMDSSLMAGT
jgi:hypothetical protein